MNTITIDGVIWAVDPDTGEITDEILGYEDAPRVDDRFQVTDEPSAAWVVAKLREAEAETVGAEEAMERELQAVRNGWTSRMRRAASKARWLRDNYADQVYAVMLPRISRGKSVKCGAGLVGAASKAAGYTIDEPDVLEAWALTKAPHILQPSKVDIRTTDPKERAGIIKRMRGLEKLGVHTSWRTTATALADAGITNAPGITHRPAREEPYIRTGITLTKAASAILKGREAPE
jgi:hypothetical protein